MKNDLRLGLALGGGSARAAAHVGVLKVLEQRGIKPLILAGSSSGAFIAGLYALGYSVADLEDLFKNFKVREFWKQALDFAPEELSWIRGKRLTNYLNSEYFKDARLEDLKIPLVIATTDLESSELVLLREGLLAKAVVASSSLPGVFAPIPWQGRWLIDGGFLATVPFKALEDYDLDLIIGVHAGIETDKSIVFKLLKGSSQSTSHFFKTVASVLPGGSLRRWARAKQIVFASYSQDLRVPENGILLKTKATINWWDFHKMPQAIADGENAMLEALKGLEDKICLAERKKKIIN